MWGRDVILSLFFLYAGEERRQGRSPREVAYPRTGQGSSWWAQAEFAGSCSSWRAAHRRGGEKSR
jgi:hypothetical protein